MKRNMIFKNALVAMAVLAAGTITTSCSDWDDHYDAETAVVGSAKSTIWENLSSNANLSQFAELMKKAGYDAVLNTTQTYTVWAPLNGTFDYDVLASVGNEKLLKEFVQNHIARNNYPASGTVEEIVSMLNEKVFTFEGAGSYSMGGISVAQPNVASNNGIIHTLNGKLDFRSNIFESLEAGPFAIDSISEYIHGYDVLRLNEEKSIQGPVVDGQITYLDSVFDDYNPLCPSYAWIDREDSNYTMIVPTNEAWKKAVQTIAPLYNYVDGLVFVESPSSTSGVSQNVDADLPNGAAYWRDSMVYHNIMSSLFFNNNLFDNTVLNTIESGGKPGNDSLVNNAGRIFYTEDANALFEGTTVIRKSNGNFVVTDDSLRMHPWMVWNPIINIECEHSLFQATSKDGTLNTNYITSGTQNPDVPGEVSNKGYIEMRASSNSSSPEVNFYLPDVRSTTYVIYGVFVPANITNIYETNIRPNNVRVQLGYNNANGTVHNPATLGTFSNDPTKVDTVCFGEFTFPVCYYGTEYYPFLRIRSAVSSGDAARLDRNWRMDRIFLVPKDLDEYMKAHPDYKYTYKTTYAGGSVIIIG